MSPIWIFAGFLVAVSAGTAPAPHAQAGTPGLLVKPENGAPNAQQLPASVGRPGVNSVGSISPSVQYPTNNLAGGGFPLGFSYVPQNYYNPAAVNTGYPGVFGTSGSYGSPVPVGSNGFNLALPGLNMNIPFGGTNLGGLFGSPSFGNIPGSTQGFSNIQGSTPTFSNFQGMTPGFSYVQGSTPTLTHIQGSTPGLGNKNVQGTTAGLSLSGNPGTGFTGYSLGTPLNYYGFPNGQGLGGFYGFSAFNPALQNTGLPGVGPVLGGSVGNPSAIIPSQAVGANPVKAPPGGPAQAVTNVPKSLK